MGGTFVITLREGFEAALILGLIYTYLEKIGSRHEFRYVTVGALLGVVASLVLGVVVTVLSGPLVDLGPDLIAAVVLFSASGCSPGTAGGCGDTLAPFEASSSGASTRLRLSSSSGSSV